MICKFTFFLLLSYEVLHKLLTHPDESTWRDFLSQNSKIIFNSINQFSDDRDERMDLFVFVCESLARNNFSRLRKFQLRKKGKKAKFTTWLVLVVRNLCIDWYRSRNGRFRLYKSIEGLGALEKRIFELIYLRGFSVQECFEIVRQDATDKPDAPQFCKSLQLIQQSLTKKNKEKLSNLLLMRKDRVRLFSSLEGKNCIDQFPEEEAQQPDGQLQRKAISQIMGEILGELPVEDKLLLKFWFETELNAVRIAELLKLAKPSQVYARLNSILSRLRRRLQEKKINYDELENLSDLDSFF